MSRIQTLILLLLATIVIGGCARSPSTYSTPRTTSPGMADAVGPSGLSQDSKRYMAFDP
jgi:hypothetical protein